MAKLILTGQSEAIDLKHLHGDDIMQLDEHVSRIVSANGGFADLCMELRRGVITFFREELTYPWRSKNKKKSA